jgi:hypothetical protein
MDVKTPIRSFGIHRGTNIQGTKYRVRTVRRLNRKEKSMTKTFSHMVATAAALAILSGSMAFAGQTRSQTIDHRQPVTTPVPTNSPAPAAAVGTVTAPPKVTVQSPVRDHRNPTETAGQRGERYDQSQITLAKNKLSQSTAIFNDASQVFNSATAARNANPKDPTAIANYNTAMKAYQISASRQSKDYAAVQQRQKEFVALEQCRAKGGCK